MWVALTQLVLALVAVWLHSRRMTLVAWFAIGCSWGLLLADLLAQLAGA